MVEHGPDQLGFLGMEHGFDPDHAIDPSRPARRMIVVYQSTDREGSTFSLSPDARRLLRERFGDKLHFAPRIFIAHETRDDFERLHGSLAKQLVALLTGLGDEHVAQVAAEFRDPVTDRSL